MLLLYNYLCSITENQNEEKQFSPNFLRSFGGSDPNIMCVRASERASQSKQMFHSIKSFTKIEMFKEHDKNKYIPLYYALHGIHTSI